MAEAIDRIARYAGRGRSAFERDELVQTWVVHHLEILGEAARRVTPELRRTHSEVPWTLASDMRNVLAHDYFGIDVARVWATVERDLPLLRQQLAKVLEALEE